MPVCRLIFRLDFKKVNFKIIDSPGEVMRLINASGDEFLPDLKENRQTRAVIGTFRSKDQLLYRSFTVEPNSIYGAIESTKGIELRSLETDSNFAGLIKLATVLCKEFEIKEIGRSGLRLFFFKSLSSENRRILDAFRRLYDEKVIQSLESELGHIDDYAVAIDGQHEDKIRYRYRCGPFTNDEAKKYLPEVGESFEESSSYNFVADLDLFERDFELTAVLAKWYQPLFVRAERTFSLFEKRLLVLDPVVK